MRVWDIDPKKLCRNHFLGEHREIHAIWLVINKKKKGYSFHPEVLRWKGKLKALYLRHEKLVKDFSRRGYKHASELKICQATGSSVQNRLINTLGEQRIILKNKNCNCQI